MAARPASGQAPRGGWPDASRPPRRRLVGRVALAGVLQAFVVVFLLQRRTDDFGPVREAVYLDPIAHWLRDAVLYAPVGVLLLLGATALARRLAARWTRAEDGPGAILLWAALGASAYAVASVPAAIVHAQLFAGGHHSLAPPALLPATQEAIVTLRYSFALLLAFCLVVGLPWGAPRRAASRPLVATPTSGRDHGC